jgi:hypothetical protein
MNHAHRIEMIVEAGGKLSLDELPFPAGQAVEVIVMPTFDVDSSLPTLKGMVLRYDHPTEPVDDDEWDAIK